MKLRSLSDRHHDLRFRKDFYVNKIGLKLIREVKNPQYKFDLLFLAPEGQEDVQIELTYNYPDPEAEVYTEGRNFGHLCFETPIILGRGPNSPFLMLNRVPNIYEYCQKLMNAGVTINRPPRDGRMAFVRSPDNISIEILQAGTLNGNKAYLPPQEPWASMPNIGKW
ncbi:hypothetical protein HDU93_007014 [Gonapodya sp. JEL0774]|nr:hypothetical protein HDU93_007014 [Gonapodya sp. JEL0774]